MNHASINPVVAKPVQFLLSIKSQVHRTGIFQLPVELQNREVVTKERKIDTPAESRAGRLV